MRPLVALCARGERRPLLLLRDYQTLCISTARCRSSPGSNSGPSRSGSSSSHSAWDELRVVFWTPRDLALYDNDVDQAFPVSSSPIWHREMRAWHSEVAPP
jgi:hypothetical protein